MTTERHLLSSVETVCKQIGYGRVIQAVQCRWALSLYQNHGFDLRAAVQGALITDTFLLSITDNVELEKQLMYFAGITSCTGITSCMDV